MKKIILLAICISTLLFSACKVDFSPNAEWKEIPVVYCILDQDEDTIWARIQRCYLVDGKITEPAKISDSINFPKGYLKVDMVSIKGSEVRDSFHFTYDTITIDDGSFANVSQPMYYCVPSQRLDSTCTFKLIVSRAATGEILAEATTQLVSCSYDELLYVRFGRPIFSFYDPGDQYNPQWYNFKNARRYEPIVRFYYGEGDDTLYADLSCGDMIENLTTQIQTISYSRYHFLSDLKNALKDDPATKKYLKFVDIYITACNEDLNAYINSSDITSIEQSHNTYSNISGGGIGIFGSRRTHLKQRIPADSANGPGSLFVEILKLDLNFD
ncbi:MAG: hypothetical protein K6F85_00525 [Bacteroidales bacterium]|nr:hypothetical protein [Bacteroidales bacterium]